MGLVLDDIDHHRRRCDACHGTDGGMVMTGCEFDLTLFHQGFSGFGILRLALEYQRANHRAA